ncbi:hypothetical protein [Pseudarthrobacter sp. efr-133-R2A-89]|nr:hypothetical protein [Pseudarthrobacter sp. efr-133-R2A-89]
MTKLRWFVAGMTAAARGVLLPTAFSDYDLSTEAGDLEVAYSLAAAL